MTTTTRFRLISGGRDLRLGDGRIRISIESPTTVADLDATVHEEDTYLVLSAPIDISPPRDHPIRLLTDLIETSPRQPGSVEVRPGAPLRLLAIVHDLDQDPSWQEAWIGQALTGVLEIAREKSLRRIGLPVLGATHGRLATGRFVHLLRKSAAARPGTSVELVLLADAVVRQELRRHLETRQGTASD